MAKAVEITQDDRFATGIFLYSALPLLRVIAEQEEKFAKKFAGKSFVFQVTVGDDQAPQKKQATHFVVEDGKWTVMVGKIHDNPDVEFAFPNMRQFSIFFSGKGMPLPKIKGWGKLGTLIKVLMTLLRMAGLLQATEIPKTEYDRHMLVKLYFYLLPSGISRLNKMNNAMVKEFTLESPDRAYAFAVSGEGNEDLQSYIRVFKGRSKSGRGAYPRCAPFLTMRFDNTYHALEILMSKAEMIPYMQKQYLIIEGAPEFGGSLGNLLFKVGYYAQGQYL